MGIGDEGVPQSRRGREKGESRKHDLPVRLVGQHVDGGFRPFLPVGEQAVEREQVLPGIDRARRVVRRVENDGSGPVRERTPDRPQVQLEVLRGLRHDRDPADVADVEEVLHEVRGDDENLVPRGEDRPQRHVQGARRPRRHDHVLPLEGQAGRPREGFGDLRPHVREPRVRHVPVQVGGRDGSEPADFFRERFGRSAVGVPQAEIENVFRAPLRFQPGPLLEHPPDPGSLPDRLADLRGDGHRFSFAARRGRLRDTSRYGMEEDLFKGKGGMHV